MIDPTFDEDGYPSEETLLALRDWPMEDAAGALDFLAAAWHWQEFGVSRELKPAEAEVVHAEPEDRFLRLATGGWSGNEELIDVFSSRMIYSVTWRLSARGGLHIFQYPPVLAGPEARE